VAVSLRIGQRDADRIGVFSGGFCWQGPGVNEDRRL
jgi:hypothetical protein